MGDQEQEERARARIGTTVRNKYRIDSLLGMGGMAVVYVATHRNPMEFAIKMLQPELSMSGDLKTRFLRRGKPTGRPRRLPSSANKRRRRRCAESPQSQATPQSEAR